MSELVEQINKLEHKAHALKEAVSTDETDDKQRRYLEALKKFDELITMQKELYGERSDPVMKSSQEAAIICNILSMSFLQKGKLKTPDRSQRISRSPSNCSEKPRASRKKETSTAP